MSGECGCVSKFGKAKVAHETRDAAVEALRVMVSHFGETVILRDRLHPYLCPNHGGWHLGRWKQSGKGTHLSQLRPLLAEVYGFHEEDAFFADEVVERAS